MRAFLTLRNSLLTRPKSGDDRRLARLQAPRGGQRARGAARGPRSFPHGSPLSGRVPEGGDRIRVLRVALQDNATRGHSGVSAAARPDLALAESTRPPCGASVS